MKKASLSMSPSIRRAFSTAKKVRMKAHAPYSGFRVGAGLVAKGGKVFAGCNVENASYGGAVCAERVAILKAVSEGAVAFTDIVVATDAAEPAFPCAFCLQVMAEFFTADTRIWVADLHGVRSSHRFEELLPRPFGPKQLFAVGKMKTDRPTRK